MSTVTAGGRVLGGAEVAYGAALTLVPATWLRRLAPAVEPDLLQRVARILAGRQLLQGALTIAAPSPSTLRRGAAVDLLHTASMVALAGAVPAARRPAAVSAAIASIAAACARRLSQR